MSETLPPSQGGEGRVPDMECSIDRRGSAKPRAAVQARRASQSSRMLQFAGPTDNEFLHLFIKISFPKWERVKSVEKLRNIVDAEFYWIVIGCGCHDVAGPIANGLPGRHNITAGSSQRLPGRSVLCHVNAWNVSRLGISRAFMSRALLPSSGAVQFSHVLHALINTLSEKTHIIMLTQCVFLMQVKALAADAEDQRSMYCSL
jgi:hypothetical protein